MSRFVTSHCFRRALLPVLAALTALPVRAQSPSAAPATPAAAAPADDTVQLPAMVVGATLRSEPVMTVPIAVAVVSGDQMVQADLRGLSDITAVIPSLTFRAGASNKDTSLLIRGVGTITTSPGVEPDVSTVVDGVVLARPGQSTMNLMDIDRVEVLRGPQGTLFGKNSSVGAINIVSRDPTEQTQGYIDATYFGGHGNEEITRISGSGALIPGKLLASASLLFDNYDGNLQNIFLHKTVNGYRNWGGRAKLIYTPTANLKATVIVSYINSYSTAPNEGPFAEAYNTSYPAGVTTPTSATTLGVIKPIVPSANNTQVNSGVFGRVYDDQDGVSVQLDSNLGDYKLTSITAYQHWYNNQYQDTGDIPQPTVGQTLSGDKGYLWFDQYSEELRVTSPLGRFFTFVSGLYFQQAIDTETYRRDIVQETAAGVLVPNYGVAHYGTHGANYAIYGEGTWNLTTQFRVITGLRLTHDTLEDYHQRIASSPTAVPGIQPGLAIHAGSTDANGVSGRAGLQFDLTKDAMVYATYSRGYKGPAYNVFFNQTALQVLPLAPETSDDYELGLKSMFWNNRVQFTITGFNTTFHNYQANEPTTVLGTPVTNLINAGQVSSKGVEADVRVRVTHELTLSSSLSRVNAKIDQFNLPPGSVNYNGQPLPFAPRFKQSTEAEYRVALTDKLNLGLETDYSWQSHQQFSITATPDTVEKAYGIVNASISLSKPSDGWRVALLGKNLANTHYDTLLAEAAGMVYRLVPRDNSAYFGISIHKDY
jgi:iron complex outermembrane receptor protein